MKNKRLKFAFLTEPAFKVLLWGSKRRSKYRVRRYFYLIKSLAGPEIKIFDYFLLRNGHARNTCYVKAMGFWFLNVYFFHACLLHLCQITWYAPGLWRATQFCFNSITSLVVTLFANATVSYSVLRQYFFQIRKVSAKISYLSIDSIIITCQVSNCQNRSIASNLS